MSLSNKPCLHDWRDSNRDPGIEYCVRCAEVKDKDWSEESPLSNKPNIDDSDKLSLKHQVMIGVAAGRTPSQQDLETAQSILEALYHRLAAEKEQIYILGRDGKPEAVEFILKDKLKAIMEIKE